MLPVPAVTNILNCAMKNRATLFVVLLSCLNLCGGMLPINQHALYTSNVAMKLNTNVDGQSTSCVDMVDVEQAGDNAADTNRQVIVEGTEFSCNGRITGYLISLVKDSSSGDYPIVQVWHPTNPTQYTRVDTECPLTESDINRMRRNGDEYYLGNVSCTGDNRIEFQSDDIIGHYHANTMRYQLWNIGTTGYTSLVRDENSPLNTFNVNGVDDSLTRQPLIKVLYGKITSYIRI